MPQIKPSTGGHKKPHGKLTAREVENMDMALKKVAEDRKSCQPEKKLAGDENSGVSEKRQTKKADKFHIVRLEVVTVKPCYQRRYFAFRRGVTMPFLGLLFAAPCALLCSAMLISSIINCPFVKSNSTTSLNKDCARQGFFRAHVKECTDNMASSGNGDVGSEFSGMTCSLVDASEMFDCLPRGPYKKESCLQRGCCWKEGSSLPKGVPICFFPLGYGSYSNVNVTQHRDKVTAFMQKKVKSPYPKDIDLLKFEACYESQSRLHVKITDANSNRFESPYPKVIPPNECKILSDRDYSVNMRESHMGFKILRNDLRTVIFDAEDIGALTYADQFLQISAKLPPGSGLYGIGEQQGPLAIDTTQYQTFTLWNHDVAPRDKVNLYGSHPFLLIRDHFESEQSQWHGLFFLNSNAIEIITQPGPSITFRTIGGILNFYWLIGGTPDKVIRQYYEVIGMPVMPPYWALGFHLCRFGYGSLERTIQVWNQTRAAGIPFDVQWNDLDYMKNGNDFTYDKTKYAGLPEFVDTLHKVNMHYIPLIDPGISAGEEPGNYAPYDEGLKLGIFIKDEENRPFIGKVWNRVSTVWPDFTNPKTSNYWYDNLRKMHDEVPFDGTWIDMNEPSNFWDGTKEGCLANSFNNPPYVPSVDGGKLFYKTVCPSAKQYAGLHYDLHNLYGISEAEVTNYAMSRIRNNKRSVIISRSTFPGHGMYASHWTGDVFSTWFDMQRSIPQILNFNMFGIPFVGADICGFNGNTTVELCARWMQLGAFYPFSRNHNTDDAFDQDPVSLGEVVTTASINALKIRYSLLPYLYYLFHRAHKSGEMVARPLFFEFPMDNKTFDIDRQFMWGSCVHIIPVLEEGMTTVTGYLPAGKWYDWDTTQTWTSETGENVNFHAPLDSIPILIKGGCILPTQEPNTTTYDSRQNPLILKVYLNNTGGAVGQFFWDDGETIGPTENLEYSLMTYWVIAKSLTGIRVHWPDNLDPEFPLLGSIIIYGECDPVSKVTFVYNGVATDVQASHDSCILNVPLYRDVKDSRFTLTWN